VHIDLEGPYSAQTGDIFLLCSDGLSGQVSDEELGAVLHCLNPEDAAETLVDLANFRGGPDNISVIIATIDGELPASMNVVAPADGTPDKGGGPLASLLIATGVCLGMLGYFFWNRLWTGVVASAVGLVAALIAAFSLRARPSSGCTPARSLGGPYGNGPHRKIDCPPNARVVASLAEIVAQLRAVPEKENASWAADVNWALFDEARQMAVDASKNADYVNAIRQYCRGIRDVMRQFRERRPTVDSSWSSLQ
jgi:protein phosphatase